MENKLCLADLNIKLESDIDFTWDAESIQFIGTIGKNEYIPIVFSFHMLNFLPAVGGERVWENEICNIYIAAQKEAREYKNPVTGVPYAISIEYSETEQKIFVLREWVEMYKGTKYMFNTFALERYLIKEQKIIFHTCYTKYQEGAILFTGFSGVGKSTQGDLWTKYKGAEVINGDRCILSKEDEEWYAWGLPFSGTSNICKNIRMPIKAIVFLNHASKEKIKKISPVISAKRLWEQMVVNQWSGSFIEQTWEILNQIVTEVPIYDYFCTKEENAVSFLYKVLYEE